jgi:hypothetical protein
MKHPNRESASIFICSGEDGVEEPSSDPAIYPDLADDANTVGGNQSQEEEYAVYYKLFCLGTDHFNIRYEADFINDGCVTAVLFSYV